MFNYNNKMETWMEFNYEKKFKSVEQFFKDTKGKICVFPLTDLLYDKADALIPHKKELYILNIEMDFYEAIKNEKIGDSIIGMGMAAPSIASKSVEWKGGIDQIIKVAGHYGNNRTLFLANDEEKGTIENKIEAITGAYLKSYVGKKDFEEHIKKQPRN